MSKYDVKFKRLALLLLPTFLRRPLIAAVAYASVIPVQYLYVRFIRWKQDTDYRLNNNGQVCYLRAVLNDISDTVDNIGFITVHHRDENLEKLLPRRESGRVLIVNRRGFSGVSAYDFWVNVPLALYGEVDTDRIRAVVNQYKLASKRFSITFA